MLLWGFIPRLANFHVLVITATDSNHPSLGCQDKAKWTYFGDAFFNVRDPETHRTPGCISQCTLPRPETRIAGAFRAVEFLHGRRRRRAAIASRTPLSNRRDQETQGAFALSRNGFQDSASRLASSGFPSSKSLPTHLKYSQRNDGSGNSYTRSLGAQRSNLLADLNADVIAGLRSRALSGHPGDAVRILMLSERLRNL